MADKIVIDTNLLNEIVKKINSKEFTMSDAEKEYGYSKKAIQRRLKEIGYSYSREKAAYEFSGSPEGTTKPQDSIEEEVGSITPEENKGTVKANSRPLGKPGRPAKYKKDPSGKNLDKTKLTLEIDNTVYKALQLKKAKESLVINKFIEDLLRENIEKEYFEFAEK